MSALAAQQTALLRPIFDSLDTGNASAGLRHCDRALLRIKSGQNYHTVLALKSFLLIKLGRATEADVLCSSLEKMVPESEIALKYMRIVMQYFKRETMFPEIVAKAYEKCPEDQGLAVLSCESYIRIRDWANVQMVSFKLYSKFHDPKMIWWSASSIYLQTLNPKHLPHNAIASLNLAYRLTTSIKTPPSPSQIWLSARILLSLAQMSSTEATPAKSKYLQDALNYLESEEVHKVLGDNRDLELEELRWEVIELLGDEQPTHQVWELEWERLKKFILGEGTDAKDTNYLTYLRLITLSIKLYKLRPDLLVQTSEVFKLLAEEAGQIDRGPLLARLELAWQYEKLDTTKSQEDDDVPRLIRAYFQAFAGKACCYEDLKPYLPTDHESIDSFLAFLDEDTDPPKSVKDLQRHINALKIRRYLSSSSSNDEDSVQTDIQMADRSMSLYKENLHLGDQLVDTELQPVDDLAIIAANSLISAWDTSRDISHLYKAVVILEHAQKASKMNHYFRLILIKLYRLLGAPILTHALYAAIKVGFIQQDTMSHLLLSRAATFGTESDGIDFSSKFEDVLRYFDASETDLPDAIITAFERQSYPQIEDFVQFHVSLQTSLQHQILQLESSRWNHLSFNQSDELMREDMKSFEGAAIKNGFKDNRDFGLMPSYQPRGLSSLEVLTGTGPEIDVQWLKTMQSVYRNVLCKAIGSSSSEVFPEDTCGPLTADEQALLELARALVSSEVGCKPKPEEEAKVIKFFEERRTRLQDLLTNPSSIAATTGWEILHLGSVALEGYVLLDLLASRSQLGSNGKRQPLVSVAHPTILAQSRSILKSVASQIKNASEKIGSTGSRKEVAKQCAGLEAIGIKSDNRILVDNASQITLSRKAALVDLTRRITHRLTQSSSN
ncbi:Mitochondrial inheritance and actin cytoskeleton organization protein [Phaffia rhodozyma]|uniref:Mitochondrial inheritance and actin cytoskeleton organization protein n=1 Tax=Phaffia rhodozyma TaxID=264483 RepID=A0A0F7SLF7_PHARH|nr:Mitochondrial inheritance and actin cytoskeleton organization protein [Phaffia rhodozyma]